MRFTKMILAMGLALAFLASHAAHNQIEFAQKTAEAPQNTQSECEIPKNLPNHYYNLHCIGKNGWLIFSDAEKPTFDDTGIMDAQGKVILPAEYFEVRELEHHKNLIEVSRSHNEKFERALLDDKLQWVLPFAADQTFYTQENSPIIRVERKQNGEPTYAPFDSKSRQFITPFRYTFLGEFSENGMAGFSTMPLHQYSKHNQNYSIGFLNEKGEEVIPEIYTQAGMFSEGINWVKDKDDVFWMIDKTGKKLWQIPHDYLIRSLSKKGLITVENRLQEKTMIDHSGKEIVPFGKFDSFRHSDNLPVLFVEKGNQKGLLDLQGNELLPLGDYDLAEDVNENDTKSVVFVKGFQVSQYDENGKLSKSTSPYAKTCAHVKLGMAHRDSPAYSVTDVSRAYRNQIEFIASSDEIITETCDDVAKPAAKKSTKSKQKRKK